MKFNLVLFHINEYDETQPGYKSLYKKCYESIQKEFQEDNIIVFHSYDEVFKKYPSLKEIIDTRFHQFFYQEYRSDATKIDLMRLLLTMYIEDMLYLDSDIVPICDLRANLIQFIEKNPKKDVFFYKSLSIFYARKYCRPIKFFLTKFTKDYFSDEPAISSSKVLFLPEVLSFNPNFFEYAGLAGIRSKITDIYTTDEIQQDDLKKLNSTSLIFLRKSKRAVFTDNTTLYYHFKDGEHKEITITFEDFLDAINATNIEIKEL